MLEAPLLISIEELICEALTVQSGNLRRNWSSVNSQHKSKKNIPKTCTGWQTIAKTTLCSRNQIKLIKSN